MDERGLTREQIGVLIVDDSAFMRTALTRIVDSDSRLRVLGTARSGDEALEKIPDLRPDVITMDVMMPGLDGLETLRCIMARHRCPVIMVSSGTTAEAEITFRALAAGAFDYVPKQLSDTSLEIFHLRDDLVAKIKAAAARRGAASGEHKPPRRAANFRGEVAGIQPAVVAMGVSTGGPKALQEILPQLPRSLTVPVLIVQHMPRGFVGTFAARLNSLCSVPVHEAVDGESIVPGVVYLAPAGLHMTVDRRANFRVHIGFCLEEGDRMHVPSVDVLMESVASVYGSQAMGIIMTGMGSDGAEGMTAIHCAGGVTVGQDEETSAVYGMPKVCAELGILDYVVPLQNIPEQIVMATSQRRRA